MVSTYCVDGRMRVYPDRRKRRVAAGQHCPGSIFSPSPSRKEERAGPSPRRSICTPGCLNLSVSAYAIVLNITGFGHAGGVRRPFILSRNPLTLTLSPFWAGEGIKPGHYGPVPETKTNV